MKNRNKSRATSALRCFLLVVCLQASVASAQAQVSVVSVDSLLTYARQHLGAPYRWGGKSPKGFDCAGFTRYVFAHFGLQLAPAAGPQYRQGTRVEADSIRPGDLVFYAGRSGGTAIGHVGLVVERDSASATFRFIHSSTTAGVIITRSTEPYYRSRYIGACRPLEYSHK